MTPLPKLALVTGASRGIGAEIAKRLARDGWRVIVNYTENKQAAQLVVAEIEALGGQAWIYQTDVSNGLAVSAMFKSIQTSFGTIDLLINNAGIMELKSLAETTEAHVNTLIDVNLKGTINTLREASKYLQHGGKIINFSTSVVNLKLENYAVYAATKAGVEVITAIMAKEMRGRNITVNAIAPGPTATELFLKGKSPELVERMAKMNPLERLGTPEDIAAVVSLLANQDSNWINGQILKANGGLI
jgi:3-oxoacyl-[acyl-carrier protein] reductase